MSVKCLRDGELSAGRRYGTIPVAVHPLHPALYGLNRCSVPSFLAIWVRKGGFFMKSTQKKGLKNVYVLVYAAMLAAMGVVIGIFCKNFLNFGNGLFRITLENFPVIIAGIAFGPVVGACVGAVADIISYMLSTQSFAISPIVTLGAAMVGAVSGLVSHYVIKLNWLPKC